MKFKNYIETESGIKDTSNSPGTAGQVLSSTVTGTSWITPASGNVSGTGTINNMTKWINTTGGLADALMTDNGSTVTLSTNGSANTFNLSHTSGSGIALNITKGGSGEALVLNKTSGSGNVLSVTGDSYFNGDVGIGTDNPQEKLHIYSTGAGPVRAEIESTQATDAVLKYTNSVRSYGTFLTQSGQFSIYDYNAASHRFYMLTNGNIGIGTTSPSDRLEVAAANSQLRLTDTDDSKFTQFSYSSGKLVVRNNSTTTTTNQFTLDFNGKMGIGTTSPNEKLEVNGSVRVTGAGLDVGYGNNSNNFVQIGNGRTTNGFAFIDLVGDTTYSDYGLRLVRNNGGANTNSEIIHRGTGALNLNVTQAGSITLKTSNLERVRINSSGNVGIGTTNPSELLHIKATASSSSSMLYLENTAWAGNMTTGIAFKNGANYTAPTAKIYTIMNGGGNQGGEIRFATLDYSGTNPNPNTTLIDRMTIDDTGNVGVGFTSPSYKLDVNGEGRFTGDLRCLSLIQTSQRDQKKDIADINKSKAKVIPFKEYKYKSSIDGSERKRYGVVVEDIEKDYPELVHTDADGIKGINYIDLLVKRVAELEKELEDISLTPGPKGDTGTTGAQGPAGADGRNGSDGRNGADGNDHLNNVESIAFNEKSGQLEITIKGNKNPFRFNPAK